MLNRTEIVATFVPWALGVVASVLTIGSGVMMKVAAAALEVPL